MNNSGIRYDKRLSSVGNIESEDENVIDLMELFRAILKHIKLIIVL